MVTINHLEDHRVTAELQQVVILHTHQVNKSCRFLLDMKLHTSGLGVKGSQKHNGNRINLLTQNPNSSLFLTLNLNPNSKSSP